MLTGAGFIDGGPSGGGPVRSFNLPPPSPPVTSDDSAVVLMAGSDGGGAAAAANGLDLPPRPLAGLLTSLWLALPAAALSVRPCAQLACRVESMPTVDNWR